MDIIFLGAEIPKTIFEESAVVMSVTLWFCVGWICVQLILLVYKVDWAFGVGSLLVNSRMMVRPKGPCDIANLSCSMLTMCISCVHALLPAWSDDRVYVDVLLHAPGDDGRFLCRLYAQLVSL